MTALLAAAAAVAAGTQLFGWAAAPLAGVALGFVEAKRRGPGSAPSAALVSARGAVAGAAGWAVLLLWRGLEAPVWGVAGLIGSVAGGLPKSLVVAFALTLPALLAGTAAGAAVAVSGLVFDAAESRRRDR